MAKGGKDKYWTASELKKRGWTKALIRDLLPRANGVMRGGNYIRLWKKEEVLAAEETARFAGKEGAKAFVRRFGPAFAASLEEAWASAPERDENAGSGVEPEAEARILAGHFHGGIVQKVSGSVKARNVKCSQAAAWLGEFLALERGGEGRNVPEIIRHFVRAGGWMDERCDRELREKARRRYPYVLLGAARQILEEFSRAQPEAELAALLGAEDFPGQLLLSEGLGAVWSVWYVPQAIRTNLSLLIALNPKDEYPEARKMHRRFILHLGGTNTGKTYAGFQRLRSARTGVYLAPLRLLALEAQETLLGFGLDCGLSTGEEEDLRDTDTHVAATAEKLDMRRHWDVAVIDECQMIADGQRGYAWTRAILGVLAPEVHLCAAPEARDLLLRIIDSCGDSAEVQVHERNTPLICMSRPVDFRHLQPGDALITFSKVGVLSVAEDLRQGGKEPAIIYGALPYATRRKQMESFLEGKMEYIVSTDAIGMGLNLPIRRVIFMETEKFDGVERRELKPEEIRQIAGRAGRYGMYNRGFVGATENLEVIRAGLEAVVPQLECAVAGFSDLVLEVDFDLLEVLTQWNRMPTAEPYRKLDISRYIAIISKMREKGILLTREQELRAANIPFDETDEALSELFFDFLQRWQRGEEIEQPGLGEGVPTLPGLESYYRKLDLYFSFAKTFDCPVDEDRLYDTREKVAEDINEILLHRLRSNIRFCARCNRPMPLHHRGQLCDACFRKTHGGRRESKK
ncbi:MAG: helicase [Butyricicoccus sp.]|nr:helicase [Butyricicoccus sp.]